mmetsp:Transcript_101359/g.285912  ORF Transcript_101359/g.285912 Transcript_101359/m.285912 type:complete len:213 (+) Transcript_101359:57-695(+)
MSVAIILICQLSLLFIYTVGSEAYFRRKDFFKPEIWVVWLAFASPHPFFLGAVQLCRGLPREHFVTLILPPLSVAASISDIVLTALSALVWIVAIGIRFKSMAELKGNFAKRPDDTPTELVTSGLYAVVRHPGYLAHVLAQLALVLHFWCYCCGRVYPFFTYAIGSLWLLVVTWFYYRGSALDETTLERTFGDGAVSAYKEKVKYRLLPGVL